MTQVRPYAPAERARARASHGVSPHLAEEYAEAEAAAVAVGQIRCVVRGADALQMTGPEVR
jgi:hypothetical protein